eukprot:6484233-Amphidinium_carterae.1
MPPIEPLGPRRVYVRKAVEVKRYNATPGCKGCIENGRNHTEECRVRMEQLMSEDADLKARVLEADAKRAKRSTTGTEGTGTEGQRENVSGTRRAAEAASGSDPRAAGAASDRGRSEQTLVAGATQREETEGGAPTGVAASSAAGPSATQRDSVPMPGPMEQEAQGDRGAKRQGGDLDDSARAHEPGQAPRDRGEKRKSDAPEEDELQKKMHVAMMA